MDFFLMRSYLLGFAPLWKGLWIFKTVVAVKFFSSQFVHCLHWQGLCKPSACFWFPSAVKNLMDLPCLYWKGLYPVHALVSTKSFYRRVHIQKAFLQCGKAYESSRRWFWFNICHKFFNVCAIRALTQQMLSWVVFTLKKNILGHISHAEGLSPVCSDHVDLQTPPT